MWDWLNRLFGRQSESGVANDIHLRARTEAALSRHLRALRSGQVGWITFSEAGHLFSANEDDPLNEMDTEGHDALGRFAALPQHRSTLRKDGAQRRVYFTRV
jgi:hypothetical protein